MNLKKSIELKGKFRGNEDDAKVAMDVVAKRNWGYNTTRTTRRQWLINGAFARSQQWSILHRTEDRLIYLQQPPGRKQVTIDVISPWKEHMIASLVTAMPKFEAVPENLDSENVSAARFGNALIQHYWDSWRFINMYITICNYLLDFGNAFVYLNYVEDGTKYTTHEVIDQSTGLIAYNDEGEPLIEKVPIGDITCDVIPPQNIVCPLDPSPFSEKAWFEIVNKRDLDYFRETYPKTGQDIKAEETFTFDFYDMSKLTDYSSHGAKEVGSMDYAHEIIYFQRPSDANPEGMVVVVANDKILLRQPWAYKKLMSNPVIHFHVNKDSNEFYARSWIERQIPLQKLYNLLWSVLAENMDDMAHLKWLIPYESGIDDITDMPDIVKYHAGFKPEQSDLKPIPQYIAMMINYLEQKIQDAQNYHGASQGGAVSGVRSNVHAENLQNQDLLPLTIVDNLMQSSFEEMGEKILLIAAEKLDEERLITYVGEDKRIMVENFRGAFLRDTKRVKVNMTNTWARNKASVVSNILEMVNLGMITDKYGQPDMTEAMRLIEFAIPESYFMRMQNATELAYRENSKLMAGEPTFVLPYQDHKMHLSVINDFMNSSEFMRLYEEADTNPQNKAIIVRFEQHAAQHEQFYMQALAGLVPAGEQQNQTQQKNQPRKRTPEKK